MKIGSLKRWIAPVLLAIFSFAVAGSVGELFAASPSASQALGLAPIQDSVDFTTPTGDAAEKCTIKSEAGDNLSGWIVYDGDGRKLRRFLDSNGDNKVDLWCYYRNGVEVYRDVDADFNGKADQYRWLGTEGTRWGLDPNEDGEIDSWKSISAEEVSAEVVAALQTRDTPRFKRLLPTAAELRTVGFGKEKQEQLAELTAAAARQFEELAQKQTKVAKESKWIHFGAAKPGVVPAGVDDSTKDIVVYDNVAAMIETDGKHDQVNLGGMVKIGDVWRLLDRPQGLLQDEPGVVGMFFGDPLQTVAAVTSQVPDAQSERAAELIREIEGAEIKLAKATSPAQTAKLHAERCTAIESLISVVQGEDRRNWIRQYADTVTTAIQANAFPQGEQRLSALLTQLKKDPKNDEVSAYVQFRLMTVQYAESLQSPSADFGKIQEKWLKDLAAFVQEFPKSDDAPEAILQLALAEEFAGKEASAKVWYQRITTNFADSPLAEKAAGAVRRIDSVGRPVTVSGTTLSNQRLSLTNYQGKIVLVHYWATWCEPCKEDMKTIRALVAKYGAQGFSALGVSLDNDAATARKYLQAARLPWEHLYEDGGLDSRLAKEMGVLTLPTMLLIDKQGKVISRNITAGELDAELQKRLR